MRRKDKAISNDEAVRLLQECEYGVLSTVDKKNQPYGVPLNYVFMGDCLYFHCALEGQKLDNILANKLVSFCVVGNTGLLPAEFNTKYESVIVSGKAELVQGEEKYQALVSLIEKYSPGFVAEGREYILHHDNSTKVVRIGIETLTGKAKR